MTCCAPSEFTDIAVAALGPADEEIRLAARTIEGDLIQTELSVPGIHCGGCIQKIETALGRLGGVEQARVNLSTRRVTLRTHDTATVRRAFGTLGELGYQAHLFDHTTQESDREYWQLIKALAVAAFGSMNIMMLSVGAWSGAEGSTRDILHLICGIIALPTLVYAGRPFYTSAWTALRHGRTNMDVPITIGVALAFLLSVYDTLTRAPHAYFDAVTSLLFFLLAGRVLDHMMREKARKAVRGLARLTARGALVVSGNGERDYLPIAEITPGMTILLAAGERVPVDATVIEGASEIDVSLVNGESAPLSAASGTALQAGTLNLTGPLTIRATAPEKSSFLAEMIRMMEAAESGRSTYRRIADTVARYYAPVVHFAAILSFLGWMLAGGGVHQSITIAIAVLIITCPCALGLAVPMVHVVAARRLFENGVMLKDGSALERLATVDTILFDKTGTLTLGSPELADSDGIAPETLALAGALGGFSGHPHSRAIARAARGLPEPRLDISAVSEHPGLGVEARQGTDLYRLGRAAWALDDQGAASGTVLSRNGELLAAFRFAEVLRPEAESAIAALRARGFDIEILSGDRAEAVEPLARRLGIATFTAGMLPGGKLARIEQLIAEGRKPMMVGDGLNDGPALAAAHVSMAPATAADIGRNSADFVFLHESLAAIPATLDVADRSARLVKQNLGLSLVYNVIALPIAVLGFVTPFVAAIAMSGSSVVVVANALRLTMSRRRNANG
ncbi:heavy metal translocating P-type ATPase [Pelagibacterium sediminicola]|uniref:heavy metal translocating P-type ATPase n=1 Tax=Pelagibacterium sediminicola TaxID=2248761 RepID=UPI000E31727B|nr:heavy metal translocating P-type ATPase [Pelagibacterium sediminicola]